MILCIETSGAFGSVALADADGRCLELFKTTAENAHAEQIPVLVSRLVGLTYERGSNIEAVAVNKGPGSYTGLRIGTSLAKGICYGFGIPLIACDGLQLLAMQAASEGFLAECYICVMDARRDEVFFAIYGPAFEVLVPLGNKILSEGVWSDYIGKDVVFCGNAVDKLKTLIPAFAGYRAHHSHVSAEWMCSDAIRQFEAGKTADLAYFEPDYGKAFYMGSSKG
jgi:tRNA threonylcarbamoyladenosine biosynthesis protein TsaB